MSWWRPLAKNNPSVIGRFGRVLYWGCTAGAALMMLFIPIGLGLPLARLSARIWPVDDDL